MQGSRRKGHRGLREKRKRKKMHLEGGKGFVAEPCLFGLTSCVDGQLETEEHQCVVRPDELTTSELNLEGVVPNLIEGWSQRSRMTEAVTVSGRLEPDSLVLGHQGIVVYAAGSDRFVEGGQD